MKSTNISNPDLFKRLKSKLERDQIRHSSPLRDSREPPRLQSEILTVDLEWMIRELERLDREVIHYKNFVQISNSSDDTVPIHHLLSK